MTIISKQKKKYPMPIYADYHFYHFYHFKTKVKISNANLCPCIFLKNLPEDVLPWSRVKTREKAFTVFSTKYGNNSMSWSVSRFRWPVKQAWTSQVQDRSRCGGGKRPRWSSARRARATGVDSEQQQQLQQQQRQRQHEKPGRQLHHAYDLWNE